MKTRTRATIEDLYNVPGKAELVNGEIILMSPSGPHHGRAAARIAFRLAAYEELTNSGHFAPDNVGFIVNLPHRELFSPDVAYYTQDALSLDFVEGAPLFAVEVRSKNDYGPKAEREIKAKRADYFAAGTQVVWDVDLQSDDVIRSYTADNPNAPTVYHKDDTANAEPALPGWTIPVSDLFR